jgi:hypothetical protein
MKQNKIFYIVELLLILMIVNPFSCSINLTNAWTVSGTTVFNGTPPVGKTIKLAGLLEHDYKFTGLIVSNVVTITNGGGFSLDIDASDLNTVDYDKIELIMWVDDNNNDTVETGEKYYYTEPASGGCPVFDSSTSCTFVWYDSKSGCIVIHAKGWNVYMRFLYTEESIDTAVLTGALITNNHTF